MIGAIREFQSLARGRHADQLAEDTASYKAILFNFVILGEAARQVPDDVAGRAPEIDWPGVRAMRNVVTHVYFGVDATRVVATIEATCLRRSRLCNVWPPALIRVRSQTLR